MPQALWWTAAEPLCAESPSAEHWADAVEPTVLRAFGCFNVAAADHSVWSSGSGCGRMWQPPLLRCLTSPRTI